MATTLQTTFQMRSLTENLWISSKISLKFVLKVTTNIGRRQAIFWTNYG